MNKYMEMAIQEAYSGIESGHGGPFGCVIVKDGVVVAKGHNTVIKDNDPTCHGEIVAIRKACEHLHTYDLSGCKLYTTGYPCIMCLGAILWSNIKKVYYGCTTQDTDSIGFRDDIFNNIMNISVQDLCFQVNRDECLKLYDTYRTIKDKQLY